MESLLTTEDDRLKGPAVVIRSNLLALRLTKRFTINQDFYLWLYEIRSSLIHGSKDPSSETPFYNISFFDKKRSQFKIKATLESEYLKIVEGILKKKEDFRNEEIIEFIRWLDKKDETFNYLYQWFKDKYPDKIILKFFEETRCIENNNQTRDYHQ